ncbi:MAG: hypothetical protein ACPGQD_06950 [Planctomycetota bacterium]
MKRTLTWLFAAGLLAIAALYLASVIWPPPGEGGPGEGAYPLLARPGVTDPSKPDPAAATPYDILPSVDRMLEELRTIVRESEPSDAVFRTNHASNYLPLAGRLPADKERIVAVLDKALAGDVALRPEHLRGL